MNTSRTIRALSLFAFLALAASSQATIIVGCNAASRTNVDCSEIFGGTYTDEGINFFTSSDYHVGYRRGVGDSPQFLNTQLAVSSHDTFATSVAGLATAAEGSGNTMVIEFENESALSGIVLSGLSQFRPREGDDDITRVETAQVVAYNAQGEKIFDQVVEGGAGYVYVDFGDVVPLIATLLVSSGGGLPGLVSSNTDIAYFITPLPEPSSLLLVLTGVVLLGLRRSKT